MKSLLPIILLATACLIACKQKPIEHVYYGDWVNVSKEEYHYDKDSMYMSGELHWTSDHGMLPESLHLYERQLYYQAFRLNSGAMMFANRGKWSMRHNQVTIQTDKYLLAGTMYVLNGMLYLEGHHYPLDEYNRADQMKGIRINSKYRPATKKDIFKTALDEINLSDYFK